MSDNSEALQVFALTLFCQLRWGLQLPDSEGGYLVFAASIRVLRMEASVAPESKGASGAVVCGLDTRITLT